MSALSFSFLNPGHQQDKQAKIGLIGIKFSQLILGVINTQHEQISLNDQKQKKVDSNLSIFLIFNNIVLRNNCYEINYKMALANYVKLDIQL